MNVAGLLPVSTGQAANPTSQQATGDGADTMPAFPELVSALLGGSDIVAAEVVGDLTAPTPEAGASEEVGSGTRSEAQLAGVHPVLIAEAIIRHLTGEQVLAAGLAPQLSSAHTLPAGEVPAQSELPDAFSGLPGMGGLSPGVTPDDDPEHERPVDDVSSALALAITTIPVTTAETPANTEAVKAEAGVGPVGPTANREIIPPQGSKADRLDPAVEATPASGDDLASRPIEPGTDEPSGVRGPADASDHRPSTDGAHTPLHGGNIDRPEQIPGAAARAGRAQETLSETMSAAARRVEQAVRRLENSPPPNVVTFTIEELDLRLTVALRPDGIHLSSPGQSAETSTLIRSLESALQSRGFDLSSGDRGRREESPETQWRPNVSPSRTRRPAVNETRL